ncbi:MAG TPA: 5-formyltetrahydrofolate cyclo-ligase [Actinomycetes bacterium]|nr:5-formyltetrahydrofolate cyclo-ligase [Actinomycetes bacterium]
MTHLEQPNRSGPVAASDATSDQQKAHKKALRATIRSARDRRPEAERTEFATRLAQWTPPEGTSRVSCFVGVGSEPDTLPLIHRLHERGIEVLLPITLKDFSLDWALYSGDDDLVDAGFGLKEPAGPRLGADAIGTAEVVLIPALAIDADGRRLGQGAGCYDRALPHVPADVPVLGVVYDDERLLEPLPEEPHDRRVDGVIP